MRYIEFEVVECHIWKCTMDEIWGQHLRDDSQLEKQISEILTYFNALLLPRIGI